MRLLQAVQRHRQRISPRHQYRGLDMMIVTSAGLSTCPAMEVACRELSAHLGYMSRQGKPHPKARSWNH